MTEKEFVENTLDFIFNLFRDYNYSLTQNDGANEKFREYYKEIRKHNYSYNIDIIRKIVDNNEELFVIKLYTVNVNGQDIIYHEETYNIEDIRKYNRNKNIDKLID